ncbi:MAG: 50S ribosomal protein L3 [Simkaniaceae bacterium]|nr:50S ribosomal protein L3 [Simkaniaceae bacterium]
MSLSLMGCKKGMTRLFDEAGNLVVCSVIEAPPNKVVQIKRKEVDGYQAVQLGAIEMKRKKVSKPLAGHFAKAAVQPCRHLLESRTDEAEGYEPGAVIGVDLFKDVSFVDVIGTSKGKGFQGVVKRHGFGGGPAAHGSGFHRTAGSTGMRSTPGKCLPGTRMAGQMGAKRVVVMGLRVILVDSEHSLLLVRGAIPGPKEGVVYVRKAVKKR